MGEKTGEYIFQIVKDMDGVYCYIKQGELVRCKDCKHWSKHYSTNYNDLAGECNYLNIRATSNFYCCMAESERREDEQ